jgi:CBS domain-containing protein
VRGLRDGASSGCRPVAPPPVPVRLLGADELRRAWRRRAEADPPAFASRFRGFPGSAISEPPDCNAASIRDDHGVRVEQLMTREVVTAHPETPLKEVAELLSSRRISGIPVVAADGRVVGVVSEADILRKEQGLASDRHGPLSWLLDPGQHDARLEARTAGEAMTAPAVTIEPGRPVSEAARAMLEFGVNRLPVVHKGELVGIVTRADLVRAFRRSDEEIEKEILDDVFLRILWLDPSRVAVSVSQGEVSLGGEVETRTQAELAEAYVRRVPGVVDVRSSLTWTVDDLARRTATGPRQV